MTKSLIQKLRIGAAALSAPLFLSSVALAETVDQITFITPKGFATTFQGFMNGVLSFVMVIAALLVFFYLIWGGIEWITSGGDKGQTEKARNKITAAVIGLIILAAAYAVLQLALGFLGFTDLNDVFRGAGSVQGPKS